MKKRKTLEDYSPRGLAGLKGFWVTCNRHYGGDARQMVNVLIWRGLMVQDPVPGNCAWTKSRVTNRLPVWWRPPPLHPDILDDPPF